MEASSIPAESAEAMEETCECNVTLNCQPCQEKAHLLTIFPTEVWLLIQNNVTDAPTFQGISDASPYFRSLLRPRATQVMFPAVFKILLGNQSSSPLLRKPREILPLRQVCGAWNAGVDQVIQNHAFFYLTDREQQEFPGSMEEKIIPDGMFIFFEEVEDLTGFQQNFDPTHLEQNKNPFVNRGVSVSLPEEPDNHDPFINACLEVFRKYGQHVWHCQIIEDDLVNLRTFYRTGLARVLELLPHLRSLMLRNSGIVDPPPEELNPLENTVFPQLHQLRKLSLDDSLPLPLVKALVEQNPQLQIVDTSNSVSSLESLKVYLEQLPNLTALSVEIDTLTDFPAAFGTTSVICPLTTLHLNLRCNSDMNRMNCAALAMIFRTLEARFSETLTELYLLFDTDTADMLEREPLELRLPHLRKLEVRMCDWDPIPLEFMLPLQNTLEELAVVLLVVDETPVETTLQSLEDWEEIRGNVKLFGRWNQLWSSNVWPMFPRLKLLRTGVILEQENDGEELNWEACTRDQWISATRAAEN